MKVKFTTLDRSVLNRPINMVYFRLRPFTVAQSVKSAVPMTKANQFRQIRSPTAPKEISSHFGRDMLGLSFKVRK